MREIKFRGKKINSGEWVVGCLTRYSEEQSIIVVDLIEGKEPWVFSETVGQYTGLKDKNGTEIYEGDIVSNGTTIIYGGGNKQTFKDVGVVRWDVKNGCIVINNKRSTKRLTHKTVKQYGIKVIGNINDNPELLEEMK